MRRWQAESGVRSRDISAGASETPVRREVRRPAYGHVVVHSRPSAHDLRGVRLGAYERWILRNVPSPGETPLPIEAPGYHPNVIDSQRRAANKLERIGLLESERRLERSRAREPRREVPLFWAGAFWERPEKTRRHVIHRRVVWATALGWGVRRACQYELAHGLPIRWTNHLLARVRYYSEGAEVFSRELRAETTEKIRQSVLEERDDPVEPTVEVVPAGVRTDADRERWRRAVDVAVRDNPRAGSTKLWQAACARFESGESLPAVRADHGPTESERFLASRNPMADYEHELCERVTVGGGIPGGPFLGESRRPPS